MKLFLARSIRNVLKSLLCRHRRNERKTCMVDSSHFLFYLLIIIIRNREVFVLKNKQIFISKERGYTYLKYLLFVAPCRISKRTSLL